MTDRGRLGAGREMVWEGGARERGRDSLFSTLSTTATGATGTTL